MTATDMPRLECDMELTEAKEPWSQTSRTSVCNLGDTHGNNKLWHSTVCTVAEIYTKCCEAGKNSRSPRGVHELMFRLSPDKVSYPVLICSLTLLKEFESAYKQLGIYMLRLSSL